MLFSVRLSVVLSVAALPVENAGMALGAAGLGAGLWQVSVFWTTSRTTSGGSSGGGEDEVEEEEEEEGEEEETGEEVESEHSDPHREDRSMTDSRLRWLSMWDVSAAAVLYPRWQTLHWNGLRVSCVLTWIFRWSLRSTKFTLSAFVFIKY